MKFIVLISSGESWYFTIFFKALGGQKFRWSVAKLRVDIEDKFVLDKLSLIESKC